VTPAEVAELLSAHGGIGLFDALELFEPPAPFVEDVRAALEDVVAAADSLVEGNVDQGAERCDVEAKVFDFLVMASHRPVLHGWRSLKTRGLRERSSGI